jgi:hypothetical protein
MVIRSRRKRYVKNMARMRDVINAYESLVRKLEGVDKRITLKRILKNKMHRCGMDSSGSG